MEVTFKKSIREPTPQSIGTSDITIEIDVGCSITLHNARHVLDLQLSLMSCSELGKKGYHLKFADNMRKLSKGSLNVAYDKLCCTL